MSIASGAPDPSVPHPPDDPEPETASLIGAVWTTPGRRWFVDREAAAPGAYWVKWEQDASVVPEGAEALTGEQVWSAGIICVYLDAEEAKGKPP